MNWHDYFTYDPEAGNLIWKRRPREYFSSDGSFKTWNTRFAGKVAGGTTGNGYWHVAVNGVKTLVHRVIWEMHYGSLAKGQRVDHENMDRGNSRITNLRKCTNSQNMMNSGKRVNNTSGFKGVTRVGDKWMSQIKVDGKNNYLGLHDTPEQAHHAYCRASQQRHGEFSRTA